jgi:1,4-alpha-glucan branching enzyme
MASMTASPKSKRVRFKLPALRGKQVYLAGSFNAWAPRALRMKWNSKQSCYAASVVLAPGRYEYKFVIDGYWCIDPYCPDWVQNPLGSLNSVVVVN